MMDLEQKTTYQNRIIFRAENKHYKKEIINYLMSGETPFDFENIIPTPTELLTISVGWGIYNGAYLSQWIEDENGNKSPLGYKLRKRLVDTYGYTNWKDWRLRNWGDCFSPKQVELQNESCLEFGYKFTTEGIPFPIAEALKSKISHADWTWLIARDGDVIRSFSSHSSFHQV
jgi:hypothetical protein